MQLEQFSRVEMVKKVVVERSEARLQWMSVWIAS